MSIRTGVVMGLLAASGLTASVAASGPGDPVAREGEGARRTRLNQMELKPFPTDAWSKLTDWQNGTAPTSSETDGQVVVLFTYASWHPRASRAVDTMLRLSERLGKQGLVVIGAHDKDGWAEASKPKAPEGVIFRLAHDSKNDLRKQLDVDQDPDVYVIDRAGQLRFADIPDSAVDGAVRQLLAETKDEAAKVNERLAEAERVRDLKDRRTTSINDQANLSDVPELPWTAPAAALYETATWPEVPMTQTERDEFNRSGKKPDARLLTLPDSGWIGGKAPNTKGKAVVLAFYHPEWARNTNYVLRMIDDFNRWQRQRARDMVVISVIIDPDKNNANSTTAPKIERDPDKLTVRIKQFQRERQFEHHVLIDMENVVLNQCLTEQNSQTIPLPHAAVISTDGTLRWWGFAGESQFQGAVDRVLANDPGIQSRRKAEEAWLKANRK